MMQAIVLMFAAFAAVMALGGANISGEAEALGDKQGFYRTFGAALLLVLAAIIIAFAAGKWL